MPIAPRYLLPTAITLARMVAVPVMVYLILDGRLAAAFWIFVLAGVSDALDGYLAKRLDAVSNIGAYLDPLADKALLVAAFLTLGHMDHIPLWLVILIVFRDVVIVGGALLYQTLTQALKMEPLFISKVNTTVQIIFVGMVLAKLGLGITAVEITEAGAYIVALTTVASGAAYVWKWGKRAFAYEERE